VHRYVVLHLNGYGGPYDMAGNTWVWTSDWCDERYYGVSPSKDPFGTVGARFYAEALGTTFLLIFV